METVAFVGLGRMGGAMARRLLDHGLAVRVWNRSGSPLLDELAGSGAERLGSAADAFDGGVVLSMLANDAAALEVFSRAALERAAPGTVHVNMATIGLAAADELTERHRDAGVAYVAAPVLGRPEVAAAGQLNVVAAGPAAAIEAASVPLGVIGKRTWVVGETPRTANLVKIAVNYNLIHAIQALAESLTLVERGGVDGQQFVDVLSDTAFSGSAYTGYGAIIAARRYSPAGFTVGLGLKDLSLAEQAAAESGFVLPTSPVLRDLFERTLADPATRDLDWSAVAEITRGLAGQQQHDGAQGVRS